MAHVKPSLLPFAVEMVCYKLKPKTSHTNKVC